MAKTSKRLKNFKRSIEKNLDSVSRFVQALNINLGDIDSSEDDIIRLNYFKRGDYHMKRIYKRLYAAAEELNFEADLIGDKYSTDASSLDESVDDDDGDDIDSVHKQEPNDLKSPKSAPPIPPIDDQSQNATEKNILLDPPESIQKKHNNHEAEKPLEEIQLQTEIDINKEKEQFEQTTPINNAQQTGNAETYKDGHEKKQVIDENISTTINDELDCYDSRYTSQSLRLISESKKENQNNQGSNLQMVDSCMMEKNVENIDNYIVIRNKSDSQPDTIYHCTTYNSESRFSFLCTHHGKILSLRVLPLSSDPKEKAKSPNIIALIKQKTPSQNQKKVTETEELVLFNIDTSRKKVKSLLRLKFKLNSDDNVSPFALRHLEESGMFEFAVLNLPDSFIHCRIAAKEQWFTELSSSAISSFKISTISIDKEKTIAINLDSYTIKDDKKYIAVMTRQVKKEQEQEHEKEQYRLHYIELNTKTKDLSIHCLKILKQSKMDSKKTNTDLEEVDGSYQCITLNSEIGFCAVLGFFKQRNQNSIGSLRLLFLDLKCLNEESSSTPKPLTAEQPNSEKSKNDSSPKDINVKENHQNEQSTPVSLDNMQNNPTIYFAETTFRNGTIPCYVIVYAISNTSMICLRLVRKIEKDKFSYRISKKELDLSTIKMPQYLKSHKISSISKTLFIEEGENNMYKGCISVTLTQGYTFHLSLPFKCTP